jgi:hypothetical protein
MVMIEYIIGAVVGAVVVVSSQVAYAFVAKQWGWAKAKAAPVVAQVEQVAVDEVKKVI